MAVNIGQANAGDEFYRYKMPQLQSKARPPTWEFGPCDACLGSARRVASGAMSARLPARGRASMRERGNNFIYLYNPWPALAD